MRRDSSIGTGGIRTFGNSHRVSQDKPAPSNHRSNEDNKDGNPNTSELEEREINMTPQHASRYEDPKAIEKLIEQRLHQILQTIYKMMPSEDPNEERVRSSRLVRKPPSAKKDGESAKTKKLMDVYFTDLMNIKFDRLAKARGLEAVSFMPPRSSQEMNVMKNMLDDDFNITISRSNT